MTAEQARQRIDDMLNEYAYSDRWPIQYQREYERLCDIIWLDYE